jgi:hypothetical protein
MIIRVEPGLSTWDLAKLTASRVWRKMNEHPKTTCAISLISAFYFSELKPKWIITACTINILFFCHRIIAIQTAHIRELEERPRRIEQTVAVGNNLEERVNRIAEDTLLMAA